MRRLCERLGVSPMQFAPNAIATIMAFLVICHRVSVEPTLQLFSNLVTVKATKKDAHFFFGQVGGRLVDIPESNKDWKEKFLWVYGADAILACRSWPEIERERLKALPLSADERRDLEKVRWYSGSRRVQNLFDNSSLRMAGLSFVLPTEADREREAELLKVVPRSAEGDAAGVAVSSGPAELQFPKKRARGGGLSAEEERQVEKNFDQMAAMLKVKAPAARASKPKRKKLKAEKTEVEQSRPDGAAEASLIADAGAPGGNAPVAGARTLRGSSPSSSPRESVSRDEVVLSSQDALDRPASGVPTSAETVPVDATTSPFPADTTAAGAAPRRVQDAGNEPTVLDGSMTPGRSLRSRLEDLGIQLPFHHRVADIGGPKWRGLRATLIGELEEGYSKQGEPSLDDRFVPDHFLHKEDSVFHSGWAQLAACEQFSLPKDKDLLQEVPSTGLRLALLSYQTRGALLGEELYNRLFFMTQVADELVKRLAQERESREAAEGKVAVLEVEKGEADAKRRDEIETTQVAIANLQAQHSEQAATILKLVEEVAQWKKAAEGAEREAAERTDRIGELERQAAADKKEKESALDDLQRERLALQNSRGELDELKAAHGTALADVQSLRSQLGLLTSEEGRRKIVEEYRHGPLGKVELSLAVKAGFDYLKAQIPSDVHDLSRFIYPPRVQGCLSVLQGLEGRGAGVRLGTDDDDDEDDDEEDESEDGDGEDGGQG